MTPLELPMASEVTRSSWAERLRSTGRDLAVFIARRPGLFAAILVVTAVAIAVVAPGVYSGDDPLVGVVAERLQVPSWRHPFGTDQVGRDMLARVAHGTAVSIWATSIAVALALVTGGCVGLVAGFAGGWLDAVLMRVVDVLLAIPSLLLSMAFVTALGFGTVNVAIAVGISGVAGFARMMRSEVLRVRSSVFVEASRSMGAQWRSVLLWHVLPNSRGPVIALATLEFGIAVLSVSALSFLGFGAQPPTPEWGSLIASGRDYMSTSWWLTTIPGVVVAATVLSLNRISVAFDEWRRR